MRLAAFLGSFLLSQGDLIFHHKLVKGRFGLLSIVPPKTPRLTPEGTPLCENLAYHLLTPSTP